MSRPLDVEIFPVATCCFLNCPTLWVKWKRCCNLVWCGIHADAHNCRRGGILGAPRKLPQGAQGLERGRSQKYSASHRKNGRAK